MKKINNNVVQFLTIAAVIFLRYLYVVAEKTPALRYLTFIDRYTYSVFLMLVVKFVVFELMNNFKITVFEVGYVEMFVEIEDRSLVNSLCALITCKENITEFH